MTHSRLKTGLIGEKVAELYLAKHGYRIIEKNFRCSMGEIDLVAYEGDVLVFVEVRTKTSMSFGLPEESIDYKKKKKLRQLAKYYCQKNRKYFDNCRIDVVSVQLDMKNKKIKDASVIKNAF